jgi:carboxy-terminal domain RNA polymerase II polypeptide A small phosphatase
MNRKLLVLDIDETLVYGTEQPLERVADLHVGQYHVYFRPHLSDFLDVCFRWFEVGVWTSSGESYACEVVRTIMAARNRVFLWDRRRCTRRYDSESASYYWVKDLAKLKRKGYCLGEILVVDDTPQKAERNYGNYIQVTEWEGDQSDNELLLLKEYLATLVAVPNVRLVEKRGWRNMKKPT